MEESVKSSKNDALDLKDILFMCLAKWYWFAISIALCLGVAVYYLLTTPPTYSRTASILIKENGRNNRNGSIDNQFAELGVFNVNTNVNNEMRTLKSMDLMNTVVRRLGLEYNYTTDGRFYKPTLYGTNLPVVVKMDDTDETESLSFTISFKDKDHIVLSDFHKKDEDEHAHLKQISGKIGDVLNTPVGKVSILPNVAYEADQFSYKNNVYVVKSPVKAAVRRYENALSVDQGDEKSNVIDLRIRDVSIQRAADVLATLIVVYNENWVQDKNQIAVSTSMFISDRLGVIESELGNVDSDISTFKSENLMPDVNAAANMAMQQASAAQNNISDLNNQVYMARYARNYLANSANNNQMLPVSTGVANTQVSSQINEYNRQLMERNSLVANSSDKNPLVGEMDANLSQLRSALISSIDNEIVSLNAKIASQRGTAGQAISQIASNPQQSKYLLSVERQQKVKESLYLYLLQKREENELSQAFTAYNTRIIEKPNGSNAPIAPKKMQILLIALVIGIAIPVAIIYLREMMNTTVRGRKDIEVLGMPMVGEIPLAGKKKTFVQRLLARIRNKKEKNLEGVVVVKANSRNIINEAMRVVRTNLEFMTGRENDKVIAITSANPDSGKTFLTYNLALSLAIKDKKVLIIDLDLRKGSLSKYIDSPKVGMSNYLGGQCDNIDKIIYQSKESPNLDVIPIGTIPPNPTELLFSDRLGQLITDMRSDYDYIFIDCPPVEIVADASIINKLADQTIFVIRAGLLQRAMLEEIKTFYTEKRYKNMSILLNGTETGGGGKYGSHYGYKYGYHYGNYGGYSSED